MKKNHRHIKQSFAAILAVFTALCLVLFALNIPIAYAAEEAQTTESEPAQPEEEPTPQSTAEPEPESAGEPAQIIEVDGAQCVDGEVIVKFKDTVSDTAVQYTLESVDSEVQQELPVNDLVVTEVPDDETVESFVDILEDQPNVEYAQPNYVYPLETTVNDPYASAQWHLDTIGVYDAWNITMGSSDVRVAVIDTGIDLDHPDLSGRIYAQTDVVDNDGSADDDDGHGTHVAGIIAANANNGIGVAGIAPGVQLIIVDVFGPEYAYTSDIVEGIQYAVSNGADVINMSLGSYENDTAFKAAIDNAVNSGVVCVAAAGNDNTTAACYPSDYESVISVIATTSSDTKASWSNYGSAKDISAPGDYIVSTYIDAGYATASGTSMASPVIAGVVALILSANPGLTVEEVKDILYSTAVDLGTQGKDSIYGWGRVDAYSAVLAASQAVSACTVSAVANGSYGSVSGNGTYNEGTSVTLSAVPYEGYRFVQWLNGGSQVSTEAVYTFTVSESCEFTAEFAMIDTPVVSAQAADATSATVSWSTVTGAAGYEVWRSTSSGGTYTKVGTSSGTAYTDAGLATGTTYYYKVNAYCTCSTATTYGMAGTCEVTVDAATINVAVIPNNTSYGSVEGGNTYSNGTSVILTATPNAGYRFVCWKNGTTTVSANAAYTFTANADVNLTAEFAPIGIPAVSAVSAGYDRNQLNWSAVEGAAGYEVWRATSASGTYTKLTTVTGTFYTDTGLTAGKTYYYKVNAYCACSTATTYGSLSGYALATPVPAAPVSAYASATGYNSVQVSWDAVPGATGYYIYRATSASGTFSYIKSTAALSYTNTSLKTGSAYFYKVRSYRIVGSSKVFGDYSGIASATPVLSPVATATATAYYPTKVKVSWSSVPGRTRYEVWRSTAENGTYTLLGTTTRTYYYSTNLTPFQTYYYHIKVYRAVSGQKVYAAATSPAASATPILNDVTNVGAAMYSTSRIKLTWSSVYGASGYEVLRWDDAQGQYVLLASTTRRYYYNTNLIPNQSYTYQVRAYRTVGTVRVYSAACTPVSATPVFGSVTNPKAVRYNSTKIKLTWTGVSGRSGYEIYRATLPDGEYELIGSTTRTYYYNGGLTTGTPYYYKIRAYVVVNGVRQYSDYSVVVTAIP